MAISNDEKHLLNTMNRRAYKVGLGTVIQDLQNGVLAAGSVSTAELAADAVTNEKLADTAVSLENLDSGLAVSNLLLAVSVDDSKVTSVEENVAGLSSAIALANELRTDYTAHIADTSDHTAAADSVNVLSEPEASDLASLIDLVTDLLSAYDAHDADAEEVAPSYHAATEAGDHSLASAVAPTTLAECITRLNDLKAKYNAHDADNTAHGVGSQHQIAAADAANGAAILVADANVASGDLVCFAILDDGTNNVTGVSAVAAAGGITFTFSGDPGDDAIISYIAVRAAA